MSLIIYVVQWPCMFKATYIDNEPGTQSYTSSKYIEIPDLVNIALFLPLIHYLQKEFLHFLDVLASSGDSDNYLEGARLVFSKAKHLLGAPNQMGYTPLHCAARACNFMMLSRLVRLAEGEDANTGSEGSMLQRVLRKQDTRGRDRPARGHSHC